MYEIMAPETIATTLTMVGQGREQKLRLVYRHKTLDEYGALLDDLREGRITPTQGVMVLVESWEASMPLSEQTLATLNQQQPGAVWAIVEGYGQSLAVARKGN